MRLDAGIRPETRNQVMAGLCPKFGCGRASSTGVRDSGRGGREVMTVRKVTKVEEKIIRDEDDGREAEERWKL